MCDGRSFDNCWSCFNSGRFLSWMNQIFWPISGCVESFLVAHEAIHDEFRVEMKSGLGGCFLITIEVFDDIIKNFRSISIYASMIDESFLSMKEV